MGSGGVREGCQSTLCILAAIALGLCLLCLLSGGVLYGVSRTFTAISTTHLVNRTTASNFTKGIDDKLDDVRSGSAEKGVMLMGKANQLFYAAVMSTMLPITLLLATAGLASGATFHSSSASAGSGLGTRGGTAFHSSTSFNGRPATTTSFTTGTGQTSSFGGVGNRGGFRPYVPRVPAFNFRPITFPRVPQVQFRPQTQFVGGGIGTRFGANRFGGGATGFSTASSTGFNSIDTNGYFNRLSDHINRSFAANLRV